MELPRFRLMLRIPMFCQEGLAAFGTYKGTTSTNGSGILLPAFAYNYEVSALSRLGDDVLIGEVRWG